MNFAIALLSERLAEVCQAVEVVLFIRKPPGAIDVPQVKHRTSHTRPTARTDQACRSGRRMSGHRGERSLHVPFPETGPSLYYGSGRPGSEGALRRCSAKPVFKMV